MSKILIEGNKVIIDGHANDLETCNTLTNLCDELSTSEKFRTVKYDSGYGEFESIVENEGKKFAGEVGTVNFYIKSNDGLSTLNSSIYNGNNITITTTGVSWYSNGSAFEYIYTGSKVFLGLSNTPNATVAKYTYGTVSVDEYDHVNSLSLYIVEADPGYQVNVNSTDGTATLAQNATVDSVVVTSTGAQLKCGDAVKATYTYAGSKLFAGLATSANATAPKYKPGDMVPITAETTFYIVENIIIPEHHSSLNELFTNIAAVIREKTGITDSIVADNFPNVIRKSLQAAPPPPYLTFKSPSSFTLKVNDITKHWDGTLEYSTDTSIWSTWDGTTTLSSATSGSDNVLYLRGTGNTVITGNKSNYRWVLTGSDISCVGNIEYLLDYATVASGGHPGMANYCYQNMFCNCTSLTQAPALPATTLTRNCYDSMFQGCTSLTQAPIELPATTLATSCYHYMFNGCTSLTQAPALPATTLEVDCYTGMFQDCTSLTQAPALPATTLDGYCYQEMFNGCTSLTQAPALPATTLADYCYCCMFQGCTSLTQAPALPATTLAESCYDSMFCNCTGLTQAPALPATTLAVYCYNSMFSDCTSLTKAPALPATTLADYCYAYMFLRCECLQFSDTQSDDYPYEYPIPYYYGAGDLIDADNERAWEYMLEGTSWGEGYNGVLRANIVLYLSTDNAIVLPDGTVIGSE